MACIISALQQSDASPRSILLFSLHTPAPYDTPCPGNIYLCFLLSFLRSRVLQPYSELRFSAPFGQPPPPTGPCAANVVQSEKQESNLFQRKKKFLMTKAPNIQITYQRNTNLNNTHLITSATTLSNTC